MASLRRNLYPHLAPLANLWHERLRLEPRFPATLTAVGFANVGAGNYVLSPSSAYAGKSADQLGAGADIGVLCATLRQYQNDAAASVTSCQATGPGS